MLHVSPTLMIIHKHKIRETGNAFEFQMKNVAHFPDYENIIL